MEKTNNLEPSLSKTAYPDEKSIPIDGGEHGGHRRRTSIEIFEALIAEGKE